MKEFNEIKKLMNEFFVYQSGMRRIFAKLDNGKMFDEYMKFDLKMIGLLEKMFIKLEKEKTQ